MLGTIAFVLVLALIGSLAAGIGFIFLWGKQLKDEELYRRNRQKL